MVYFITGATGFIGRHLVERLLARRQQIVVLVREGSADRLERARAAWGESAELVVPVRGDLRLPGLGIGAAERERLRGQVGHFFHLGAVYDLAADAGTLEAANVLGTRRAVEFAGEIGAQCFHHVSSIAVAGFYHGRFTEHMFAEATGLEHPYFRTKHEAEALVRDTCRIPWRIYRPGMVVGHSQTGAIDKVDGPYYLFKPIQMLRRLLPSWLTLPGFRGGYINLVPVDYVAAALAHLAHLPGEDNRCFHLTAPQDLRLGEVLNLFAHAAHAPSLRLDASAWSATLTPLLQALREPLRPLRHVLDQLLVDLDVPRSALSLLQYPAQFDGSEARRLLEPAGITVPPLPSYAWRLWDFWERRLEHDASQPDALRHAVMGKTVLVTGGSSGIGRATAIQLAAAGAHVLIVARDAVRLDGVRQEISDAGGRVDSFTCDLTDSRACASLMTRLLAEQPPIDILINNAGRSIRRAVAEAYDRLHDYERLMRINYLAAVQVTLALLPAMSARGAGHVISISSIGVLSNAPRFSAYNASKAALEAFSRSAAAEFKSRGVHFSIVNLPLVRTPMVAPTRFYQQLRLLEPEQAASLVCQAVIRRPERLATALGTLSQAVELLAPSLGRAIMSESFRLFPSGTPADRAHAGAPGPLAAGAVPAVEGAVSAELRQWAELLNGIQS